MPDTTLLLASALRDRLRVISHREFYARDPAAHLSALKEVSGRIEELQRQLPEPVDPRLRHFLERCSYDKALDLLDSSAKEG